MSEKQKISNGAPPVILGLEASGEHASVALLHDGTIIAEIRRDERHGHASYFVSLAKECLTQAGVAFSDLTHIAAGVGPGSFTGLRVCLSAAKGFVLAGGLVGIGIDGLRARSFAALQHGVSGSIIACADTRRGVFFAQRFDDKLIAQDAISEQSKQELIALSKQHLIILPPHEDEGFDGAQKVDMTARHIAQWAWRDLQDGTPLSPLDPLYVVAPKLGPVKQA